jgi:serine/threonine protein kinase
VVAGRPYTTAVDMWSIGTLLFMLLGGQPPFQDQSFQGLFRKIQAADYDFSSPTWKNVSIPAKQCLASLLRVDPYYRSTATQAMQANWFTACDDAQLSGRDLTSSVRELKTWVAKRRFKSAVHAVKLTSHFSRFVAKDQASLLKKVQAWDNTTNNNTETDQDDATLLAQWKGKTQNFEQLYEIQDKIGKGQKQSTVYKCIHKKNRNCVAAKKIPKNVSDDCEQAVLHEVAVLQNLKHPNMVQIVDFLEDDEYYYVLLEHVPGKTVMEHLLEQSTSFTEEGARAILEPLLQVIAYIHREGVVHRDVTLDNLLMADATEANDKPTVKLCDFGLARRVRVPRSVIRCCGTPLYMAPEVIKHIPYDQSADMWSVGVLLYMLLVGAPPFGGTTSEAELFDQIRNGQWAFPSDCQISDAAKELVEKLLVVEPLQRWTAEEALRSKWFQEEASSLSSIDLSKNLGKLKELRSKFKSVAMAVIMMKPSPRNCMRKTSTTVNSGGLVVDAEGTELGKEVDLASYQKTAESLFLQDPEQKDDDASRVASSHTSSTRHVV